LVPVLVARDPNQDLDSIPNLGMGVQSVAWGDLMDITTATYIAVVIAVFILLFWTYME
jgi:hypothetical protein